ncbi:HU family DNA-binding protein [Loktanella agnita]|uniref:HU family DNA-binding protein n=1 Tax=Loktanella agnita TaxID=287097 RepID=UPI0039882EE1
MNEETPDMIRKAEFLERVTIRSGLKKRDVKPALEAAMAELADALIKGEELVVPPLGKLRVVKSKEINNGAQVLTLKLRTPNDASRQVKTGLAEPDDDG